MCLTVHSRGNFRTVLVHARKIDYSGLCIMSNLRIILGWVYIPYVSEQGPSVGHRRILASECHSEIPSYTPTKRRAYLHCFKQFCRIHLDLVETDE